MNLLEMQISNMCKDVEICNYLEARNISQYSEDDNSRFF